MLKWPYNDIKLHNFYIFLTYYDNLYHFFGFLTKENPKILIMDEKVIYWLHNSFKTFDVRVIFTSRDAVNVLLMFFEMCVWQNCVKIYQYAGKLINYTKNCIRKTENYYTDAKNRSFSSFYSMFWHLKPSNFWTLKFCNNIS